jgi:hypothetical protein
MHFPFWLVTPIRADPSAPEGECGTPWLPLGFSRAEKMAEYLAAPPSGQWEVRLVNRYSAAEVFAELRQRGCEAICFDAERNVSEHRKIPLDEAIALLEASD